MATTHAGLSHSLPDPLAARTMSEFDAFPAWLRRALADSPYPWGHEAVATVYAQLGGSQAAILGVLARPLPDLVARTYGPTHPQAR